MIILERQVMRCGWKVEHGFWPAQHHSMAIHFAQLHAGKVRNAALILQRMSAHLCLICGSPLTPAKD